MSEWEAFCAYADTITKATVLGYLLLNIAFLVGAGVVLLERCRTKQ